MTDVRMPKSAATAIDLRSVSGLLPGPWCRRPAGAVACTRPDKTESDPVSTTASPCRKNRARLLAVMAQVLACAACSTSFTNQVE
jgi:hypothetical protein